MKKETKAKDIKDLQPDELIELARLSSFIHKHYPADKYKYLGLKYEYKTLKVPKEWRKKALHTAFHVVFMPAKPEEKKAHGQLDRIFVVNYQLRDAFHLYNVMPGGKLTQVAPLWQDDQFQMSRFLISRGYDIPSK